MPIPSSSEMRELQDLATDKGVREFIRRSTAAGQPLGSAHADAERDRDSQAYDDERTVAWQPHESGSNSTGSGIGFFGVAGYTDIAVRPGGYDEARLRPDELEPALVNNVVRLRGWPVPMVDQRIPVQRFGKWIAQDITSEVVHHEEAWRLLASAQFLHRRVLATDLGDSPAYAPTVPNVSKTVAVWDVLLYMVEVDEFGAPWATALGCSSMTFEVALNNVSERQLVAGDRTRNFRALMSWGRKESALPRRSMLLSCSQTHESSGCGWRNDCCGNSAPTYQTRSSSTINSRSSTAHSRCCFGRSLLRTAADRPNYLVGRIG